MNISCNPIYRCNFRCSFCYLTEEQLRSKQTLDLSRLDEMIHEITVTHGDEIEYVDLYGGELGVLPDVYLDSLIQRFSRVATEGINIITNLSVVKSAFLDPNINLSVSYDFDLREKSNEVLMNILTLERNVSILILATPDMMNRAVEPDIALLNSIRNVTNVEIKPYSENQSNQLGHDYTQFEQYVRQWIDSPTRDFELTNQKQIQRCRDREYSSFSDNHVYITPTGKFGVLEFDHRDCEYFQELDSYQSYFDWTIIERERVQQNEHCSKCEFFGHCLSEHLREVTDISKSCNGFIGLLQRE